MDDLSVGYVGEGYVEDGYVLGYPNIRPEWADVITTEILPSYLYQQYYPKENEVDFGLSAFFIAYNALAQNYLDYVNTLNLPVWTSTNVIGLTLDWVAKNVYGFVRPTLVYGGVLLDGGVYNTVEYNVLPYNDSVIIDGTIINVATDDIFKRCLTWNLYRGDGYHFNFRWLKNRVYRFLSGTNGIPTIYPDFYLISVVSTSYNHIKITIDPSFSADIVTIFKAALTSGALNLPFIYTVTVAT